MISVMENREKCCGCSACKMICPVSAIQLKEDSEGFLYPVVDSSVCVKCEQCLSVCPLRNAAKKKDQMKPRTYAVKHKNLEIRKLSRSGGIFTALTDYVLQMKGVVYGAVLQKDFSVKHMRATTEEQRNTMRGSKYVQSMMGNTFKDVKKDLKENKYVLFSGTSCQVDGLLSYLGENNKKLITVDIVCHGVPSLKVLQKYIKWRETLCESRLIKFDFRNKVDFGWADHIETLWMKNGKRIDSKVFANIFYSDYALRPSCYVCPYKSIYHPSDISIADYWGIDKACPDFNDNKGVSLVLLNSSKGEKYFECVKEFVTAKETRIEDSMQTPFIKASERPEDRAHFWKMLEEENFSEIATRYGNYTKKEQINEKIYFSKSKLKKMLGRADKKSDSYIS